MKNWIWNIGFVASLALPFFNLPLIVRVIQRRSSTDISLVWVTGVWLCLALMEPIAWLSTDPVFRVFATVNLVLFSGVTFTVFYFRWKK